VDDGYWGADTEARRFHGPTFLLGRLRLTGPQCGWLTTDCALALPGRGIGSNATPASEVVGVNESRGMAVAASAGQRALRRS